MHQALDPLSCLPRTHHLLFWYISSVPRSLSTRNPELTGVLYFCLLCLASRPPDSPSPPLFPKHMEHGRLTSCSFFAVSPPLHYPRIQIPEARTVSAPSPFLNRMPSAKHWGSRPRRPGRHSRIGVARLSLHSSRTGRGRPRVGSLCTCLVGSTLQWQSMWPLGSQSFIYFLSGSL